MQLHPAVIQILAIACKGHSSAWPDLRAQRNATPSTDHAAARRRRSPASPILEIHVEGALLLRTERYAAQWAQEGRQTCPPPIRALADANFLIGSARSS